MTIEETQARDQARSRAIEQLAEMRGSVEVIGDRVVVVPELPVNWRELPTEAHIAWSDNVKTGQAKPGDPEALVKAIGLTHRSWKAWSER